MGDVMKESAQIAISYVRLLCSGRTYHIDKNYFDNHEKIREGVKKSIEHQNEIDLITLG